MEAEAQQAEDLNQNKQTAPMLVMSSSGTGCGDGIPPAPHRVTRFAERDDFTKCKPLATFKTGEARRGFPKRDHQAALSRLGPETPGCPSSQRCRCVSELIEWSDRVFTAPPLLSGLVYSIKSLLHNLPTQNEGRITSTSLLLICDDGKFPVKK